MKGMVAEVILHGEPLCIRAGLIANRGRGNMRYRAFTPAMRRVSSRRRTEAIESWKRSRGIESSLFGGRRQRRSRRMHRRQTQLIQIFAS